MYSAVTYTAPGGIADFAIPFPYLDTAHLEVSVNGVPKPFTVPNAGTVRLVATPGNGASVLIRRNSNRVGRLVDFTNGANLTETDLDRDSNQLMYLVQEAFDQVTTQSYFSTDAGGARVTNVHDPVADSDAATQGWVRAYVTSISGAGTNLLPLNNTWTGINTFSNTVKFGAANMDVSFAGSRNYLLLDQGIRIVEYNNNPTYASQGLYVECRRDSGAEGQTALLGRAMQLGTTSWSAINYGLAVDAWKGPVANGTTVGAYISAVTLNGNDQRYEKVGIDVGFGNRELNQTQSGYSPTYAIPVQGTQGNWYNANSWAIQISSQSRAEGGATYVGWNRGLRFRSEWGDVAKIPAYDVSRAYHPGDYVTNGGYVWMAREEVPAGTAPLTQDVNWSKLFAGSEAKAIGIDFSGVSQTTMDRMAGAIKLRGLMPIIWDAEQHCTTSYNPLNGRWSIFNDNVEMFGLDVGTTGAARSDMYLHGELRVLGTRSSVSAHRNLSDYALGPNVWTPIPFPFKERDDRVEFNASTGEFQPNTPGDYMVVMQAQILNAVADKRLHLSVLKNGAFYKATGQATNAGVNTLTCSCLVRMNGTSDKLTFQTMWVDAGGSSVTITGEPAGTYVTISKVS